MRREILEALGVLNNVKNTLGRIYLKIDNFGIVHSTLKDQLRNLEEDNIQKDPFGLGPSVKQLCILGLAVRQEEQNDFISQEQIDEINHIMAFNRLITFKDVQEYNRKYI